MRPAARPVAAVLCAAALFAGARAVWAGAQNEAQLADAVRSALSAALSESRPPRPVFSSSAMQWHYLRWLAEMSARLSGRIAQASARVELIEAVHYEARRAGLDPALVLGLIQVESGFRAYAISRSGAMGLMQVMPFWTRSIGDGDTRKLFHLQSNLRYGCMILRHYLDREGGNLYRALGRYNGSRGQSRYPDAVLAASQRWQYRETADARDPFSPQRMMGMWDVGLACGDQPCSARSARMAGRLRQ